MPSLPTLQTPTARGRSAARAPADSVVLAVYAPFGTDKVLSVYPNSSQMPVHKQALVRALQKVAAEGVHVAALIDLYEDDTWLVEIPAGQPKAMSIVSTWKQDMAAPQTLAGFLRRVGDRFPCAMPVLAIEGHGGGFVPDIDPAKLTPRSVSRWQQGGQQGQVRWVKAEADTRFESEPGSPALPMSSPELPMSSPELPATRLPMSTWALGAALAAAFKAGARRPAVIHFNNCFNASVELLHTVAPHADVAAGYANYDFFTAGEAYAQVFRRLRLAGTASSLQLAQWFADENGKLLRAKRNHPTVGAAIVLSRVKTLAAHIDSLALTLTKALQVPNAGARALALASIKRAVTDAQHYDTDAGYALKVPDQFMDIGSFASQLRIQFPSGDVHAAAGALLGALGGVWQYGDWDRPWLDESQVWDFRKTDLGLNIFFPDPALEGRWDWRSPYYLSGVADPAAAPAHRHVIPFLADTDGARPRWVEFIVEYHRNVKFIGFFPARAPAFPLFNLPFKPTLPHPGDQRPGTGDGKT